MSAAFLFKFPLHLYGEAERSGDDSVREALSVQAGAPEFDLESSCLFSGPVMCACDLSAGSRGGQILGWTDDS